MRPLAVALCLSLVAGPVLADSAASGAGVPHAAWRACLGEAFARQAALSGPAFAADAALRACREPEAVYLAALSDSPLLDATDVGRARPALLARARAWLMAGRSL